MLKYLLPLFFYSSIFALSLSVENEPLELDKAFIIKSNKAIFGNSFGYTHKQLLKCTPKIEVVYNIQSSYLLKVIPKIALPSGIDFKCSYKDEDFSFTTKPFEIVSAKYFSNFKLLRLEFNDNIKKSSIKNGIKLFKVDNLVKTKLRYFIKGFNGKYLTLKIGEKLNDSPLELLITKELKTVYNRALNKQYKRVFDQKWQEFYPDSQKSSLFFRDNPKIIPLENGKFALRIFSPEKLKKFSKKYIHIEGIENFSINNENYMWYSMRKKFHVRDSYYYYDIISDEFQPNHSYKITLKRGITAYDREIKKDLHFTLTTGDRAKAITFDQDKLYISNHGELSFLTANIQKATLVVDRITNDNLRYFLNFKNADKDNVSYLTREIFKKDLIFNQKRNTIIRQKFKLSDLNKKALPVGVYKISLHYTALDKYSHKPQEKVVSKVLFLSNLGIIANLAKDEVLVSVFSLDKAKAIKNATVEIYAKNNDLIATGYTNKDGIALIKKQKLIKQHPVGIIVHTANDKNFLSLNMPINSPTQQELLKKPKQFTSYIYFQSNIVRPASKIHALIVVKNKNFISASKLPFKVVLKEINGKKLLEKVYHSDEYGLIDFNYQLDYSDNTGNYLLQIFLGDTIIGSKKLKVEAFMPPKIENSIKTDKEYYQIEDLMEINISSSYLFGAPSSNLQGKISLYARPIDYTNKNYKNYNFVNKTLAKQNTTSYLDYHKDIVLDKKGKYSIVFKNHINKKIPSILEAMIGVSIMDDSQPVSTYKRVKIYPYKAMVGIKLNSYSFEKNKMLKGKAILIDPITSKEIKRTLYAQIKRVYWHYNYSSHNYHWEKEINVVDNFTIASNEEFSRKIPENGDYIIEVSDHLTGHSASSDFEVWWWNYTNLSPNNDLKKVSIDFEDKLYKRGDNIEVKLKSPILEGQLLIILEGEKIDNYKLIKIHKGVAKTSIKIQNEIKQGLYLHAIAIRASDSDSKLVPFRAMGYKFIKPDHNAHKIKVKLILPKVTKSKVKLPIKIETSKPSEVLVSIVDRGILQLVNQEKPKIFEFFNKRPKAKVSYYDFYDQLLAYITKGKLVDFGAGDLLIKKQKHLAPNIAKRIKPFMIWSKIINLKEKRGTIDVNIPEFNGRASVVAIAIGKDSVGASSKDIFVKDDVMIKPSYPRFLLVGDHILLPVRIFNTSKSKKQVRLKVKSSNNLKFKLKDNNLTILANSSKRVIADLFATAKGKAEIKLSAKYDKTAVTKSVELPILSPYALSTKTFKGVSNTPSIFTIPKEYKDAKVYITLSDNLVGALRNDLHYLVQYPYGCAEQTSSGISAMNFAKPFLKDDELAKDSKFFILQGVKKLENMQNYYGEFNYWLGKNYVHAYASLYAAQALLDIEKSGGPVSKSFKESIVKMLKNVATANTKYSASYSNFDRIFAAYILAEHHLLPKNIANMLFENDIYRGYFLATSYMAAILKEVGDTKRANKLFYDNDYMLYTYTYNKNNMNNFGSDIRDMMLHFIVKSQYFDKDAKDLEMIQKEFSNLYSTQTKAVALKAISVYLGHPTNNKLNVTLFANNTTSNYKKPKLIILDKIKSPTIELNPNGLAMSYSIELAKNIPFAISNKIDKSKELSIKREFIDKNGNNINLKDLKQGDKIFSKITIANYKKINQVVINQRIPACFEIVNNNIKDKKARFKDSNIEIKHKEIRDDRILYFVNLHKGKRAWNSHFKRYENLQNIGTLYSEFIVSSVGECKFPALITEAMYDTRINDYAKDTDTVVVKPIP